MMKEDYLWNKNGSDAELERLEIALKTFRYQEIAPPELPAKIMQFEAKSPRRFFRFALAFGSLACLSLIFLGVWFQFSNKQIDAAKNAPEIIAPPIAEDSINQIEPEKQANLSGEKIEMPKQSIAQKVVKVKKVVPTINRQNNAKARNVAVGNSQNLTARKVEIKKHSDKLTNEETYAYNQLMLALSITGSKLKLVRDKIDRME